MSSRCSGNNRSHPCRGKSVTLSYFFFLLPQGEKEGRKARSSRPYSQTIPVCCSNDLRSSIGPAFSTGQAVKLPTKIRRKSSIET